MIKYKTLNKENLRKNSVHSHINYIHICYLNWLIDLSKSEYFDLICGKVKLVETFLIFQILHNISHFF